MGVGFVLVWVLSEHACVSVLSVIGAWFLGVVSGVGSFTCWWPVVFSECFFDASFWVCVGFVLVGFSQK